MNKKYILIILIIITLIGFIFIMNNKKEDIILNKNVSRVELLNVHDLKENNASVFAFGEIESMEEVDIRAQVGGEINAIYVSVGDVAQVGDLLIELDHESLDVQLEQAAAAVERVESSLNQVLAGATDERISAIEAQMNSAEIVYENAQDSLSNLKGINDKNLYSTYDSAINTLNDAYIKDKSAYDTIKNIQELYFIDNDQESIKVRDSKRDVLFDLDSIELDINKAEETKNYEDIDSAILSMRGILLNTIDALQEIEDVSDSIHYKDVVSSAYRTALATQKNYINASYSALNTIENSLLLLKDQNASSLNSAEAQVDIAKSNYEAARSNYEAIIADPRDVDISALEASVKEVKAAYNLVKNNRDNAFIRAPIYGKISALPIKRNNLVSAGQVVVSMVNDSGIKVKTYVSPEDRKLIKEGVSVVVNDSISGNVSSIAPSIDDMTKKIEVNVAIADNDNLLIGEYVNIEIDISEELLDDDIYFLPIESISITPQKTSVFIVNSDNEIEEVNIVTGRVVNDLIEVLDGIDPEMSIVKSIRGINKGDKVEIE